MTLSRLQLKRQSAWIFLLMVAIGFGLFWQREFSDVSRRALENAYGGRLPKPTEPALVDPLKELVLPPQETRPMRITHIPKIRMDQKLPHPFVGPCINCHLFEGGPAEGSQYKTPVGAVLEQLSKNVTKLGPSITPESERPHPPAGRCIKCHDMIVHVPVQKSDLLWQY
jgi:hypothetical protein